MRVPGAGDAKLIFRRVCFQVAVKRGAASETARVRV